MSKEKETPLSEEEIAQAFEVAMAKGEVTDIMGNPIEEDDLIEVAKDEDVEVQRILYAIRHLQGMILTIVDATYQNEEKIKYVKDLVKNAFSTQSNWIFELMIREWEEPTEEPTE